MRIEVNSWKDISLPGAKKDFWQSMNARNEVKRTTVDAIVKNWRMTSRVLACPPYEVNFVNPLRLERVGEVIFRKWKKSNITTIAITAIFLIGVSLLDVCNGRGWNFSITMALVLMFETSVYLSCLKPTDLAELSEYFTAVSGYARRCVWFPACIACISYFASQFGFGTPDRAAYEYGAIVSEMDSHNLWRLATSSFIHADFNHWMLNNFMLVILFSLVSFRSFWVAVIVFFSGTITSQVAYVCLALLGFSHSDLLVGFSGGIFALLAFYLFESIFEFELYPRRIYVVVVAFALLALVGGRLVNPHMSLVAHVAGFLAGSIAYSASRLYERIV